METTPNVFALAIAALADWNNHRTGSWAAFVDLGNGFGAKFYQNASERDHAQVAQQVAHEAGFAPYAAPETIDVSTPKNMDHPSNVRFGPTMFGYLTETVEVDNVWPEDEEVDALMAAMKVAGFPTEDIGPGMNIGVRQNGQVVSFDFDPNFALSGFWGDEFPG